MIKKQKKKSISFKNTIQQYSQQFRGGNHQKQDKWERKELNSLISSLLIL